MKYPQSNTMTHSLTSTFLSGGPWMTSITIECQWCRRVDHSEGDSLTSALIQVKLLGLSGWSVRGEGSKGIDLCPGCARKARERLRLYRGRFSRQ